MKFPPFCQLNELMNITSGKIQSNVTLQRNLDVFVFFFSFEFPAFEIARFKNSNRCHFQNKFFLFHILSCTTLMQYSCTFFENFKEILSQMQYISFGWLHEKPQFFNKINSQRLIIATSRIRNRKIVPFATSTKWPTYFIFRSIGRNVCS